MAKQQNSEKEPGSFRDPSGLLFYRNGFIYRQINYTYKEHYDSLMDSGLYVALVESELLISHQELDKKHGFSEKAYKVIQPEPISFISYPYEWCFSQLKDAALTTLGIQKKSLEFAMSLKDCSGYNIQFRKGKPLLIDTLSFEKYREGQPWTAYRQFCQHFLAPLTLMHYRDVRLNQLLRVHIDGIPLDITARLLPLRSRLHFGLLSHIHLHAKSQKHFADRTGVPARGKMSHVSILGLIDSLETAVNRLKWNPKDTEWGNYYEDLNYATEALDDKKRLVSEFLDRIQPESVWDLGSNVGMFSRIASNKGITTMSFDIDPACVEKNYLEAVHNNETLILPLLLDLTNPSSGLGWQHHERKSFMERGPADTVLALALLHHLAIANNLPFESIADFLARISRSLIIEFIPKNDSQVQKLLSTREDIFPDYTQKDFEKVFKHFFTIQEVAKITGSQRTLYLMVSNL
jgi:ribosomal protein L11 methylase PrmA